MHELEKKREYGDCICNVDCESFMPQLVFFLQEFGQEGYHFLQPSARQFFYHGSTIRFTSYNQMPLWMHCALSFSPLRSAVLAICGSRKLQSTEHSPVSTELHAFSGEPYSY